MPSLKPIAEQPPADARLTAPHLLLPAPFCSSPDPPQLLTQGAEALVFRTTYPSPSYPIALKFRPRKPYRHPILDVRLTRSRLMAEARVLLRCRKGGVDVPGVVGADWEGSGSTGGGWLALEWIDGWTVRKVLDWWCAKQVHTPAQAQGHTREQEQETNLPADAKDEPVEVSAEDEIYILMRTIGTLISKTHSIGVIHGDLTTSNLMLRRSPSGTSDSSIPASDDSVPPSLAGKVALIDFGLTIASIQDEDRAVDLYVLERAFAATHPAAEGLFKTVLEAYGEGYKGAKVVLKRLEDVRMRGRKRSMLG